MDKFCVVGENELDGTIQVSGSKNAVLPILAATILTDESVLIHHVPHLRDVTTMLELLACLGAKANLADKMSLEIDTANINNYCAPYELVKTMRASVLVLGPLLGRYKEAIVSLPGGCAIGSRPVDFHLDAMRALGATIEVKDGYIKAVAPKGLHGAVISFPKVTVTGTENAVMAAVLAKGRTTINNAAREPEVSDLCNFLNKIGAKIKGIDTETLSIDGVESLHGGEHTVLPDRIEGGTYLIAGAITRGRVTLERVTPEHLTSLLDLLREAGAEITCTKDTITLNMHGTRPRAVSFETEEYPGIATDFQAQLMALNCLAHGEGRVVENIFENRYMHVHELARMGANININGKEVITKGVDVLTGAPVMATDLRASAGLVLAALMATGKTMIQRIYHIDRGYECIEEKLYQLGASIKRVRN